MIDGATPAIAVTSVSRISVSCGNIPDIDVTISCAPSWSCSFAPSAPVISPVRPKRMSLKPGRISPIIEFFRPLKVL